MPDDGLCRIGTTTRLDTGTHYVLLALKIQLSDISFIQVRSRKVNIVWRTTVVCGGKYVEVVESSNDRFECRDASDASIELGRDHPASCLPCGLFLVGKER